MAPPQAIPVLGQMEDTPVQVSHLWWVPYLNNGCRPDFNNGLEGDSNSGPVLAPWRLLQSDSKNGPSPSHSNVVSEEVYICSSLLLMMSWWLPYLDKGPMPDFNSGPGNDSNIGCILALQCLFGSNLNNSPSPSHSSLVPNGVYICSGLCPRAAGLTSIMAQDVTRMVAFGPPAFIRI